MESHLIALTGQIDIWIKCINDSRGTRIIKEVLETEVEDQMKREERKLKIIRKRMKRLQEEAQKTGGRAPQSHAEGE